MMYMAFHTLHNGSSVHPLNFVVHVSPSLSCVLCTHFASLKDLLPDLKLSMLLRLAFPVGGEASGGDMLEEAMKVSERIGTVGGSCVRTQTTCSPILSHALMYWLNQHTLLANAARGV